MTGGKKTDLRKICEDYCRQYPDVKDLTLAKKVWKENAKICKNTEAARNKIRLIRGHVGALNRKKLSDKSLIKPLTYDTTNSKKPFKEEVNTSARVLVLDIETAPIRAYVWGIWQQNVGLNQIQSDWFCLTWAAKWLFEDKVFSAKLTPDEVIKQDDKRIIQGVWEMLNQADIVIAHNGEKFDIPKLNTRFILNGLQPPLPYQQIDTLKHIRRQFGFTSNKLDYVNKLLNLERKTDTGGFELWEKCMKGEQEALDLMEHYNVNDVRILEETYLHIRAWIKPHPNMGLFILDETQSRCPSCGSLEMQEMGKHYYTSANAYVAQRCGNCGATARKRLADITIKQRRHLLMSTPK
jgi:DNA polymerase elongation subunit (family B)